MAQPIWTTPAGTLGTFPVGIYISIEILAVPVLPATSVTYTLLSASLPEGLSIDNLGIIFGTPSLVTQETTSTFTIRATDNLGNIRDRTFSMAITGTAVPAFTTPNGTILTSNDSVWIELQIGYVNPDSNNSVNVILTNGLLPPGVEINEKGLIRGYAEPPIELIYSPEVVTVAVATTDTTNVITCLSTTQFIIGRPVTFSGSSLFGGIENTATYYIKSIINNTSFTISTTQDGPTMVLSKGTGIMNVTLPSISIGQPTIRTYNFTLKLISSLGGGSGSYNITIINQNTSRSQGGPGFPINSRIPTIFNTRPQSYDITDINQYYGYYVLPPIDSTYNTYPPSTPAFIGTIQSNNYFAFKIIGYDFDGNQIGYLFSDLPSTLTGDSSTGWITGTPTISSQGINQFNFGVAVYKIANPTIQTPVFNFSFNLANAITGVITWVTPNNLGTISNGTISTKSVLATSDVNLEFRVIDGELPPNLTLLSNGQITGYVADQPTTDFLENGDSTLFTFTIQAYSPSYPIVFSNKTFTLTVLQEFAQPTDILYIKATPSIQDRVIIDSLLTDDTLIPYDLLYRPNDINFGKATSVIYEHAYGIFASDIGEYIAAVTRNHYWRNITLGELKTAVAKDENGNIIYEVVYSQVIDNLVNPQGVSVESSIYWPSLIDLGQGPWYTSVTNVFTSYEDVLGQLYYASLTPGYARTLYPNSLYNMRNRVGQVLGQEYDSRLLPLWMTSQQKDGNTLGYTQAWVICYTQPGCAEIIKNNINTNWIQSNGSPYTLNLINFKIDRFSVDKSMTYNYDNRLVPPAWTGLPSGTPVPNPVDSKDFYVLFPRQTILPDESQY
jgi:hypothetical protein